MINDWKNERIFETDSFSIQTGSQGTQLDLSNLVVLGTSLASGVQDGALYNAGQRNSFPIQLAQQIKKLTDVKGLQEFVQPDINSENGYHLVFNTNPAETEFFGKSIFDLGTLQPVALLNGEAPTAYSGDKAKIRNFSAPLLQVGQMGIASTGGPQDSNPAFSAFYQRYASNPGTSTMISDALATQPSFFIYEGGINDALLYALTGGGAPITDESTFSSAVSGTIGGLASAGTVTNLGEIKGVVLNIPNILFFPFFRAIGYNAIELDTAKVLALNRGFEGFNTLLDAAVLNGFLDVTDAANRKVEYSVGKNSILVVDTTLKDLGPFFDQLRFIDTIKSDADRMQLAFFEQARPLDSGELVLLSAGSILGSEFDGDTTTKETPIGAAVPLGYSLTGVSEGNRYFLSFAEQNTIETNRQAYNAILKKTISDFNQQNGDILLVDIEKIFADAAGLPLVLNGDGIPGLLSQGAIYTPDFNPFTGIFSTDGIHPCTRGYGLITNAIIQAMNERWRSEIPEISISRLSGAPYKLP